MAKVFISYRTEDNEHATGRIYEHLAKRFRKRNIFWFRKDDHLGYVPQHVLNEVRQSQVVLALIGKQWLVARDASGDRRIADSEKNRLY